MIHRPHTDGVFRWGAETIATTLPLFRSLHETDGCEPPHQRQGTPDGPQKRRTGRPMEEAMPKVESDQRRRRRLPGPERRPVMEHRHAGRRHRPLRGAPRRPLGGRPGNTGTFGVERRRHLRRGQDPNGQLQLHDRRGRDQHRRMDRRRPVPCRRPDRHRRHSRWSSSTSKWPSSCGTCYRATTAEHACRLSGR